MSEWRSTTAVLLLWLMGSYGFLGLAVVIKPLILHAAGGFVPMRSGLSGWVAIAVVLLLSTALGVVLAKAAFMPVSWAGALETVLALTAISLATTTVLFMAVFQIGAWLNVFLPGKMA